MYHEDFDTMSTPSSLQRQLRYALEGRLIRMNSLLALPTLSGVYLATVLDIDEEGVASQDVVYRVGTNSEFHLDVVHVDNLVAPESSKQSAWERDCPGYEDLRQQIILLSQLTGVAAPAGVLLTGCAGVGKSRLVSIAPPVVYNSGVQLLLTSSAPGIFTGLLFSSLCINIA